MIIRLHCCLILVVMLSCIGCGDGIQTHAVKGVVTYKNAPVVGAEVALSPMGDDPSAKPARGMTDSSGNFTVSTYFAPGDDRSGALAGKYKITLQKIPQTDGIVDPYKPGGMPKNELPAIYASPLTTPFEREVTTGKNDWPLELKD